MASRRNHRLVTWTTLLGNLLGAVLTFCYFRFIDYDAPATPGRLRGFEYVYFVLGFGLLGFIGYRIGSRSAAAFRLIDTTTGEVERAELKRRALLLPYDLAGVTLVGWVLAGVIWGVAWPLLAGTFTVRGSLRSVFGITCIAGSVTTAFVFFAIEHRWRTMLPAMFPEGDLASVPRAVRLPVRTRLLVMFLLVSVIPLSLLGVVAGSRAAALVGTDPATAGDVVRAMLILVVFLVAVATLAASGIALFVSHSVAAPLGRLRLAMGEVEQGDLGVVAPVVSNDEIGALTEGFNRMVHGLRDRERMRETFGKYVSPQVRDEILAGRVTLEGQLREVTILFSDLRDFTPWVERTDPREVVHDLNTYFTEMEQAIRAHRGLVLQFIGDEIEAVFGAPIADPAHAEMAARAAIEMRARLGEWNAARARTGRPGLRHGIGIHTGTVLAANIGSSERLSYALVGDAVNLASRIQDLTKQAGADILVSDATRRHLSGSFDLTPLPAVRVKGRSEEVAVYRLA
jgi:class 3 adenylate cyclase